MSVNMGQAVGYLDLDTTKFKAGFKSALADLKVFQSQTATSKDKLSAFSSAATSTGRSLTKGLTVPIAAIGAASVAVTAKFDKGMSKVKAISGATGKEMELLRDKAKEMGAKTKFSATESAEAFSYMAMAGWKTNDMLDGIEGVMNLAAASGEDLATTSDIVTDALTAFGLSAKDSTHFADVLAAASSNANTNVSMMGETFKYVAPVAGALGFNVEDCSVAIGLMANSGIKGSQAGTALRNIFTRMVKPTKESAKVMEELGISVTDSSGQMKDFDTIMGDLRKGFAGLSEAEKAQAASALAGQYGMSGLLAIVNTSEKDYNKLSQAINNADGASKKMADTMMDNLPGALTLAKSALEGLGIRIGEVITPAVTQVVKVFTKFISWLSQAGDGTIRFAVAMGTILAAIGPVLIITGTLTRSVLSLIEAYNMLSTVMAGKSVTGFLKAAAAKTKDAAATVMDTLANMRYQASLRGGVGPISGMISKVLALASAHKIAAGAALGIVGAVVGLAIYMKQTGTSIGELKDKIVGVFNNIVDQLPQILEMVSSVAVSIVKSIPDILSSVISTLGPMLSTALSGLGSAVLQGISVMKDVIPQLLDWWAKDMPKMIEAGGDIAVNFINGLSETLPQLIDQASDSLIELVDSFTENLPAYIDAGMKVAMGLLNGIVQTLPKLASAGVKMATELLKGLTKTLPQVISGIVNAFSTTIGPIISAVLEVLMQIIDVLIANLPTIINAVVMILMAVVGAIAQNAPVIIQAAFKIALAIVTGLLRALPQIVLAAVKIALAIVKAVLSIVGALMAAGVKLINALWKGISKMVSKLLNNMRKIGTNIVKSVWNGIKSLLSSLLNNIRNAGKKMVSNLKSGLGNLRSVGLKWILSLWNGIKSRVSSIMSGIKSAGKRAVRSIKSGLGNLRSAGRSWISSLWSGISSRIGGVISSVRGKVSGWAGQVKGALGSLYSAGYNFIAGLGRGIMAKVGSVISTLKSKLSAAASLAAKIFKLGSPSRLMHQYGVWFMEGLENGFIQGFKPVIGTLTKQLNEVVSVYSPLEDYDFGIDGRLAAASIGIESTEGSQGDKSGGDATIINYITVSGADNPEEFAGRLVTKMKQDWRTT